MYLNHKLLLFLSIITHTYDNHIKFYVSLQFLQIVAAAATVAAAAVDADAVGTGNVPAVGTDAAVDVHLTTFIVQ